MRTFGNVRLFVGRTRGIHLSRCATAGAMLTCCAAILNVGPFATAGLDRLSDGTAQPRTLIITEPTEQVLLSSSHVEVTQNIEMTNDIETTQNTETAPPDLETTQSDVATTQQAIVETAAQRHLAEPAPHSTEASEPVRHWFDLASLSIVPVGALASPLLAPTDRRGDIETQVPQQDLDAADPNAPHDPHDDGSIDPLKKAAIVGVWAPDSGTCSAKNFRQGVLPAVINTDGAWAGETFCIFKSKKQTETGLKVVAECANSRERWTANVRLTAEGNRLTWTSKRGTQTYTRCASDMLMVKAR